MEITNGKAKPTVANVSMTSANTEYSYTLPEGTRSFWMKLRDPGYSAQVAMVEGDSNTTYFTIQNQKTHKEEEVKSSNTVLYFRSTQASMVMEIISFR